MPGVTWIERLMNTVADRGRERGGNLTRQSLSLGIGRGRGEASTTAPANTTLRIAFAL